MVFVAHVECEFEEVPSLWEFVAVLVPELLLVDGDAYEVESELFESFEVVFLNVQPSCLSPFFRLGEPMAQVGSSLDAEISLFFA